MKLTKRKLKRIIKEELQNVLQEGSCKSPATGMDDDTRCGHGKRCFKGKCVKRTLGVDRELDKFDSDKEPHSTSGGSDSRRIPNRESKLRRLGNLQLEFAANAGDANATGGVDGTGGEQKISGNEVLARLKEILEAWKDPENESAVDYKNAIQALVTELEPGITAE